MKFIRILIPHLPKIALAIMRYAFGRIKVARAQRAGETSRRKAAQGTEVEAMSRFIALHCGDETSALLSQHPNAFLLLTQIAMRAKWKDCSITRLKAGQAFIGDWREAGLKSEKAYRHAKTILSDCKLATFQGANKGTIATLADSKVFSISADGRGGQGGELTDSPGADKGRSKGGQGATNHTDTQNTPSTPTERASLPEVESSGRRFPDHTAIQARIGSLAPRVESPGSLGRKRTPSPSRRPWSV